MNDAPSPAFTPERRAAVLDGINEHIARHPRPRRRRRWLPVAIASVVVIAAAGTATAWIALAPPEVQTHNVWCYAQASTDSRASEGQLDDSIDLSKVADNARSLCATAWHDGLVGRESSPHDSRGPFPVPTLAVCGRDDGTVAVFPAPGARVPAGFCDSLGLFDYRG